MIVYDVDCLDRTQVWRRSENISNLWICETNRLLAKQSGVEQIDYVSSYEFYSQDCYYL